MHPSNLVTDKVDEEEEALSRKVNLKNLMLTDNIGS